VVHGLDRQTRGFLRDSTRLGIGSVVVVVGYAAQIALITHLLGVQRYGVFVIVVATVDLVARLVDFQVGPMTTAYAADSLRAEPTRAVGIAQFSYLIDTAAGVVGFLVVVAVSAPASKYLLGGGDWVLFVLYGLTMLVNTTETTSIALLQLAGRFGLILRLTVVRETLRVTLVTVAAAGFGSVEAVILALLLMEALMAALWTISANTVLRQRSGGIGLLRPCLSETRGARREMSRMVLHTNLISYVKVLAAQGPTILLGAMCPPTEAGLFKVGTSIAAVVGKPADPAWAAILPRLSKLRAAGRGTEMRALIRQASIGAFVLLGVTGAVAIVLRDPLLRLFGGKEALAAATVLVLSVAARVVNGTVFWNTPLLYALMEARRASRVFLATGVVFVPVLIISIDRWGADGAAGALLFWSVLVNAGLTVSALRALRVASRADDDTTLAAA
jgi:O-antigen/teichoic acid export membrane protein